ncbi:MAG: HEAT repeat domain-containing protein [Phycisphaerae bacterium]
MKKFVYILAVAICIQPWLYAAVEQVSADSNAAKEQLEINKNALLFGTDEQIRFKAAALMLDSSDPTARSVILEVLKQNDNQQARLALCQAISESRGQKTISNSEEFILPLMTFLIEQRDPAGIKLASDALLIFKYDQLEQPLSAIIADNSLPLDARLNAIQALRLQPDIRAIVRMIELLDNPDEQIVAAASDALKSLAIPVVGTDKATRRQMIEEIQRIGKEEFLYYWRMRQEYEKQIESLKTERDSWRQKYLAGLDELYARLGVDAAARIRFLSEYLVAARPEERLWAVSKITLWLHGTEPKSNLRSELGPLLIKLISDENAQVRLNVARVMALMPELDSSQTLLSQLIVETEDDVRTEQFAALGQTCRYAFSPQSTVKPDPAIKKQTLDMAVEYLRSDLPAKSQRGAEVIRNLLEFNGIPDEQISLYLSALSERYRRADNSVALRGELLNSMAILCAQSAYSTQAAKMYREFFTAAMADEDDLVRQAAVNGLININKSEAYQRLRTEFINDKSPNIRKRLISLAEELGTADDLGWLSEKLNSAPEEAAAWKAMLRIFNSCDSTVLSKWIEPLDQKNIPPARLIAFYETVEQKAQAEDKTALLDQVRYKLAGLYAQTQQRDKAKEYYGDLIRTEKNPAQRDQLRAELLELYLNDGQMKLAGSLVTNRLLEDDIDDTCAIGKTLISFVGSSPQQSRELLDELNQIKLIGIKPKPRWKQFLRQLAQQQPADANAVPLINAG